MAKVKYTGKWSGHPSRVLPGLGTVLMGQTIEVPDDTAARWTQKRVGAHGEVSDFELVKTPKPKVDEVPAPEPEQVGAADEDMNDE